MTTVSFKGPWDEALLPWGEGADSHTSGVPREGRMLYPRYLDTCSLLKMSLGPQTPCKIQLVIRVGVILCGREREGWWQIWVRQSTN